MLFIGKPKGRSRMISYIYIYIYIYMYIDIYSRGQAPALETSFLVWRSGGEGLAL